MRKSFFDLEHAARKTRTRHDIFLNRLERLALQAKLERAIAPFYPVSGMPGRPPIALARIPRV